ncbi:Importin-5 [Nymphon striatum]|nr:Importin-5 [Nymphon striatum]
MKRKLTLRILPDTVSLNLKVTWANYQAFIMLNFMNPDAPSSPLQHGWSLREGKCLPIWYSQPALRQRLRDARTNRTVDSDTDSDTSDCNSDSDSDSDGYDTKISCTIWKLYLYFQSSTVYVVCNMADTADFIKFVQLLTDFSSTDNEVRKQAETTYEGILGERKVVFLMQCLSLPDCSDVVKEMACVLLRKLFVMEFEFYSKMSDVDQQTLRSQLLQLVQFEELLHKKKKYGDAAVELARNLIDLSLLIDFTSFISFFLPNSDEDGNNHWPEFLKFLFDSANSPVPETKETALSMFTSVPGIFGNQQNNYLEVIKQMLLLNLQDQSNGRIRFAAVKAICAFLIANEEDTSLKKHYADCLPFMIQVFTESVGHDDNAVLKSLVELADSCPDFFRSRISSLLEVLMKLISTRECEDSTKQLAVEVILTLAENAPAMFRKTSSKYIPTFISHLLDMMMDLEDDTEWAVADDTADEEEDSNAAVAEAGLDRLACGLGGKAVLPTIVAGVPQMLQNPDWKRRHAALMAISAVGEGCHKHMETILHQIVDGILPFLSDPHPRVRYAVCNAIGQMSTDFAPVFEKKFHDKVVPGLLMLLDDNDNIRVQAHAAAALVNFAEECPKLILCKYLESIMCKLEAILTSKFKELIESGKKLVLEQVVTTIATVADTAEEKFLQYYDRFIPCLKYILQNANSPELKVLRGKTIECISLIGLAVGKEKFIPDSEDIMKLLLKSQTNEEELADDDPQVAYMIAAWARICKILGSDFLPYIPLVMGLIMKTASIKPEVAVLNNDEIPNADDEDWQFVNLGDQQNFGIRTAGLDEKATACQMLVCYARELKEGFADYAEEVLRLMVPMLRFYFHDSVRIAAAESLPLLLECAKVKGQPFIEGMWNFMLPELLKSLETEPDNDVLGDLMHSLAKCIELLGKGCLTEINMTELLTFMDKMLKNHFEKAADRQKQRKDEDYDEQVEEALDDEDVYLLSKVCDIVHSIFYTHKEEFFLYFDRLLPNFVLLLAPERPWSDHQWGLCIFDDLIEHGGPACIKYQEYFLRPLITYVTDGSAEVRQAAAYGVGVLGQFGGEGFAQTCAESIPQLLEVIRAPESRSPENASATENAIAAITKILKYNASKIINTEEILTHWLSWLPVHEDEDEAPHVYNYLCDLIENNHPVILGENNCNIPRLIAIMAEVFCHEILDSKDEVTQRMIRIVRQVQSNNDVFSACLSQMNVTQQQALHTMLSQC